MEENFNPALFSGSEGLLTQMAAPKLKRHRQPGYRTGDLVLNKQDILDEVEFMTLPGQFPVPVIKKVDPFGLPSQAMPFSKIVNKDNKELMVVFYEPDTNFARILHNPRRYVEPLKRFACVVGPDFSQKIGMNEFVCYSNNWWNKVLTAYYQSQGVTMVPNVTWSDPASFAYAFLGIPNHSVIAINCTGIKGNHAAMYLWRKGYEEALRVLKPVLIIRYGDIMPCEREDISVYFENINLKNLRNGRKRITR